MLLFKKADSGGDTFHLHFMKDTNPGKRFLRPVRTSPQATIIWRKTMQSITCFDGKGRAPQKL